MRFFKHFMAELGRQVELGEGATDTDYLRFQRSVNANVRSGARIRHEVLLRKLLTFDPSAFDLLDPTAVAEGGPTASIREGGERIVRLITTINEAYSAQHGEDLFKPTNRTAMTLTRLGKRIGTLNEYQQLLDDLYFLFRESVGQRLAADVPPSFADVNQLRTDMKHDVITAKGEGRGKEEDHRRDVQTLLGSLIALHSRSRAVSSATGEPPSIARIGLTPSDRETRRLMRRSTTELLVPPKPPQYRSDSIAFLRSSSNTDA